MNNVQEGLADIEDGAAPITDLASKIPADLIQEYGVLIHQIEMTRNNIESKTTIAVEFIEAEKVLVVNAYSGEGDAVTAVIVEKSTFTSWNATVEFNDYETDFTTPENLIVNGYTMTASFLNSINNAADWVSRVGGVLEILHGATTEDSVEQLAIVQGLLTIGGTYAPPGVSHMLEFYHDAIGTAMVLIGNVITNSTVQTLDSAISMASDGDGLTETELQHLYWQTNVHDERLFGKQWFKEHNLVDQDLGNEGQ